MDEERNVRYIPDNYNMIEGKILNIIETIIVDVVLVSIIASFDLTWKQNIYVGVPILPLTVFLYTGISGQSVGMATYNYVRFLKKRRTLGKPTQEYMREKAKENLKKKQKELAKKGERKK